MVVLSASGNPLRISCSDPACDTEDTFSSTPLLSINSVIGVVTPPTLSYLVCVVATGLQNLLKDLSTLLFPSSRFSVLASYMFA